MVPRLFLLAILISSCLASVAQSKKMQIEILQHQKDSLNAVIANERWAYSQEKDALNKSMAQKDSKINSLMSDVKAKNDQVLSIQKQLQVLRDSIALLQRELLAKNRLHFEPEMVFVEGGTFQMGSAFGVDYDRPVHAVTLSSFYIGKYEVTQKQWLEVMGSNPSAFTNCDQCPVESVSWNDVQDYIQRLNAQTGKQYRLPTEAEWEFAARGGLEGKGYVYSGSNDLQEVGYFYDNSNGETHSVGNKRPNELGIFDMSGNVSEYCNDWYGAYGSNPVKNPQGPASGDYRVLRGGSWYDYAQNCRSANRDVDDPDGRIDLLGFRLVLSSSSPGK